MRSSAIVSVLAMWAASSSLMAQAPFPSPAVQTTVSRIEHDIMGRGYEIPRGPAWTIPALTVVTDSTVPYGAVVAQSLQHFRSCTELQARSYHPCVLVDALEVYAIDSSAGDHVIVGVIPRTFVGSSTNDATEIEPSPGALADAGIIARRYDGKVVRSSIGGTPSTADLSPRPGAAVLSSSDALGRAQVEAARQGYRMGIGPARMLRAFAELGPSPAATGSEFLGLMAAQRDCTPADVATHRPCLRIDWLEIFFGPEPGGTVARTGVIPHTAVGTRAEDLTEVEAGSEVVASAAAVAQKSGGRVVHAILWQIPVAPPSH